MVVFCFCSKTHNTSECWSGPQNALLKKQCPSVLTLSQSAFWWAHVFLFCLSQNCWRTGPCPLFCLCLKKPRISKSNVQLRYGVFLIFEYFQTRPDLFCPKNSNMYTTLKGGLLKMSKGLSDVLLLSGPFSKFINGSEDVSQKSKSNSQMACLCFSLALSLESSSLWTSKHIFQTDSTTHCGVIVFCLCRKELSAQTWWAGVLGSLKLSAVRDMSSVLPLPLPLPQKSWEYQKSQ